MDGSLALVGSGEYLPAMTSFEKSLLDDGIKNGKAAHYIQIPTAAGRESDDRLAYWRELGQGQADAIGVKATFLPIFTREDAFKPFTSFTHGGTGLGLAIARDIARAHGGDVFLEDSPLGGLRARIRIPG